MSLKAFINHINDEDNFILKERRLDKNSETMFEALRLMDKFYIDINPHITAHDAEVLKQRVDQLFIEQGFK